MDQVPIERINNSTGGELGSLWRNSLSVLVAYLRCKHPELSRKEASIIAARSLDDLKRDAKKYLKKEAKNDCSSVDSRSA